MLFEAIQKGEVKFQTTNKSCIPPKKQLIVMQENGYTFKKDGKPYNLVNK